MKIKVPATIDKPLEILGLEPPEMAIVVGITGFFLIFISPMVSILTLFISWWITVRVKRNKPRGYIVHKVARFMGRIGSFSFPRGVYRP